MSVQRWTCSECGLTIKLRKFPVHCACGNVSYGRFQELALESFRKKRLATCQTCDSYNDRRCKLIEAGCRPAFLRQLKTATGKCPLGKWEHYMAAYPRGMISTWTWPSVRVLNLLYHVCPLKGNDVWRANVRQLAKRLRIFNGRKVVAVVTGDKLHGPQVVRDEFHDPTIEYLEIPNDPQLREVATFLPLLESVASENPDEASFYAHTKGNSTRDDALGAEMWRNAMYHHLLDGVNTCRDLLLTHPCVGTHKMVWPENTPPYPSRLKHGNWMFAGTFFWFRHQDIYGHPQWREIPADRYGAEAWLSGLFDASQAATVFQPWPASEYPTPSPYDPALYLWPIRDV